VIVIVSSFNNLIFLNNAYSDNLSRFFREAINVKPWKFSRLTNDIGFPEAVACCNAAANFAGCFSAMSPSSIFKLSLFPSGHCVNDEFLI
jgi:hypothetical protein